MQRNLLHRSYWKLLRLIGFERLSWDSQYQSGVWPSPGRSPKTLKRVVELAKGGRMVEFGCGEAAMVNHLPPGTFSDYFGYDISQVAIARAKERLEKERRSNCFVDCCNMKDWTPIDSVSLILVEECIYYLSPQQVEEFLLRCSKSLTPDGSILVIVHDGEKHERTLNACRRVCIVKNETRDGRVFLTLGKCNKV